MRLIDADALIQMLRHDIDCYDIGKPDNQIYINAKDVENMINGQATACDMDRIVEQIECEYLMCRCKNNEVCTYPETTGCCYDNGIKKAIEIVKSGVIK